MGTVGLATPLPFLSTPSARRATTCHAAGILLLRISIHALREEGDREECNNPSEVAISIHALREEGDGYSYKMIAIPTLFLSTPSARRATYTRIL